MLITVFVFFFFFLSPQSDYRGDDEWHGEQLCGQVESQLRAELEESQKQLKCAQDTQQEQKNKVHSLRYNLATAMKMGIFIIFNDVMNMVRQPLTQYEAQTNILSGNTTNYWRRVM